MSLPKRNEIDDEYQWDLSRIFATPDAWDAAWEELRRAVREFESNLGGPPESADELRSLVDDVADLYRRKQRLELYATLRQDGRGSTDADERMRRYHDLSTAFESAIAGALQVIRQTDDDALDALAGDLGDRRRYLANLRSQADHRRSPAVEAVVEEFSEARDAPNHAIVAATTEDFDPPQLERPGGERIAITKGRLQQELSTLDRGYRKRVYEAFYAELARFEETVATSYVEKLKAASALADVREYDSVRDMALHGRTYPENGLTFDLSDKIHDAMIEAVMDNLDPRRRARRLRADRLGLDTLRPWDHDVSLTDASEPEIPYEDACDRIVDALHPLGPAYQDRVERFFAEDRVDAYECEGKRNDIPGYCAAAADDGAFVMLNYQNDVRTMFYLCHELGHAIHADLHSEGPAMYATCPRPVEEVPSILHELLLVEHCLNEGGPLADHALDRLLSFVDGNFYNAAMWSAFTHRVASSVDDGEAPDAERIAGEFASLQTTFDPVTEFPDGAGKHWLNSSLYRDPYHFYQYVLGVTGALSVHNSLRSGEVTPRDYREFLRSTGRGDPMALFARLGLDVTRPGPYENTAATFDDYLDRV